MAQCPTKNENNTKLRSITQSLRTVRSSAIKRTYTNKRSLLTQTSNRNPASKASSHSSTTQAPHSALHDILEAGLPSSQDAVAYSQPAFQSIHELRRAGANDRFCVEVGDILDRICTAGPGRRDALCELASQIHRGDFPQRFYDNNMPTTFIQHAKDEADVLTCFCYMVVITTLLTGKSASRTAPQVCRYELVPFFLNCLSQPLGVKEISQCTTPPISSDVYHVLGVVSQQLGHLNMLDTVKKLPSLTQDLQYHITLQDLSLLTLYLLSETCVDQSFISLTTPLLDCLFDIIDGCNSADTSSAVYSFVIVEAWCMKKVSFGDRPSWKPVQVRIAFDQLYKILPLDIRTVSEIRSMTFRLSLNITQGTTQGGGGSIDGSSYIPGSRHRKKKLLSLLVESVSKRIMFLIDNFNGTLGQMIHKDVVLLINLLINIVGESTSDRRLLLEIEGQGDASLQTMLRVSRELYLKASETMIAGNDLLDVGNAYEFQSILIGYLILDPLMHATWVHANGISISAAITEIIPNIRQILQSDLSGKHLDNTSIRLNRLIADLQLVAVGVP
jgi:hypothetical protein